MRHDDPVLFAIRDEGSPASGVLATQPAPGRVELILVREGVPLKATLDGEQAVGLGLALLLANRQEYEAWTQADEGMAGEPVGAPARGAAGRDANWKICSCGGA